MSVIEVNESIVVIDYEAPTLCYLFHLKAGRYNTFDEATGLQHILVVFVYY